MFRRSIGVAAMSCIAVVASAGVALAQTTTYPPSPSDLTSVAGAGGSNGDGTAFTGAQVSFAMIALVVLVVLGVTALVVARRRSARLAD